MLCIAALLKLFVLSLRTASAEVILFLELSKLSLFVKISPRSLICLPNFLYSAEKALGSISDLIFSKFRLTSCPKSLPPVIALCKSTGSAGVDEVELTGAAEAGASSGAEVAVALDASAKAAL